MTNGRGAAMASFMTKKKKYKFQVDLCLEELLEVPFVSAVLFAKLRLLDGGSFQDHSSREEVRDHKVKWNAKFSFPCKMMANASTGVLERCVLRISVRKECKGGRSFNKLGFVDLNLAEYAGAGMIPRKALLEGYDTRHRQDNSMLKFSITVNMISGDLVFKVPSPSLKHKSINVEDTEPRSDEFSSGSLAGSIASGSSGFGSLPKKRPNLLSSDLVIGQTLAEGNIPVTLATDNSDNVHIIAPEHDEAAATNIEHGHSRNSSNTSQLSKASGYSSIHSHSHSRQSSSGDSGHIRNIGKSIRIPNFTSNSPKVHRVNTYPNRFKLPSFIPSTHKEIFSTPEGFSVSPPSFATPSKPALNLDISQYYTPTQNSNLSASSAEDYKTPDCSFDTNADIFSQNFNELQKSASTSFVESVKRPFLLTVEDVDIRKSERIKERPRITQSDIIRLSLDESKKQHKNNEGFCRSKSDFEIPRINPTAPKESNFRILSFFTPRPKRKDTGKQSTPNASSSSNFKIPLSPIQKHKLHNFPEQRATSMNSVRSGTSGGGYDGQQLGVQQIIRSLPHRKLLEGTSGGKLAPLAISPDETPTTVSSDCSLTPAIRRPSVTTNPSSSSLVLSETGSLDRAKAAYERRKKNQSQDAEPASTVPGRVEITRVNPDHLIEELLKNTNLEQPDDSAESSGLQLFIAKDGTAALGNHEVKSQMSTGAQIFKQVVMDDNR